MQTNKKQTKIQTYKHAKLDATPNPHILIPLVESIGIPLNQYIVYSQNGIPIIATTASGICATPRSSTPRRRLHAPEHVFAKRVLRNLRLPFHGALHCIVSKCYENLRLGDGRFHNFVRPGQLITMDLKDMADKRRPLNKLDYKQRVNAVVSSAASTTVASNIAKSFRKVCERAVAKKGGAGRG